MRSRRIALIAKNRNNPAYEGARIGAVRVAAEHGATIEFDAPETADDIDEQRVLIEAALAADVDGFVVIPAHETTLEQTWRRIKERGLPLAHVVDETTGGAADCFVGSDDHALAVAIADRLIQTVGGIGDLVIVEGHPDSPTAGPRTRGFLDAIAAAPGSRVVASVRGDYHRDRARDALAGVLAGGAAIDGILAANDFMALGVLDALAAAGATAPVIGVNATPDGVREIKAGRLLASAAFDAQKMACLAVEAVVRLADGEPVPPRIELPVAIVDGSNYGPWDLPYDERPLPVWTDIVG